MENLSIKQVLTNLGKDILNWVKSNCVNNCVSTTTNLPLAAAQGKALQDQITALNSNIGLLHGFAVDCSTSIGDCNKMYNGIYASRTAKNLPVANTWTIIVANSADSNSLFNMQIALSVPNNTPTLYLRSANNGTYTKWTKVQNVV